LVELQIRDAREVPHIARQQDELMLDRGGRDQQIKIGDELALAAKIGARAGKPFHDAIVEWQ
jgi:hypothetical protein